MSEIWKADEEVHTAVSALVAAYHPHLAICDQEIAVLFKDKASKSGDIVIPGVASKAGPQFKALGDRDYKFILTIGSDVWTEYNDTQRTALLDRLLCACRVEEDPKSGEFKYRIAKPDVNFFREEVERHGFWLTSGAKPSSTVVAAVFGESDEDSAQTNSGEQ